LAGGSSAARRDGAGCASLGPSGAASALAGSGGTGVADALQGKLDRLAADRDRLEARLASLGRHYRLHP
jgi:hypothetical protein